MTILINMLYYLLKCNKIIIICYYIKDDIYIYNINILIYIMFYFLLVSLLCFIRIDHYKRKVCINVYIY